VRCSGIVRGFCRARMMELTTLCLVIAGRSAAEGGTCRSPVSAAGDFKEHC